MPEAPYHAVQPLLWPEQGVSTERDLYLRLHGPAYFSDDVNQICFGEDGVAEFNTAMNVFNIGKWLRHCALEDLALSLTGEGRFELIVFQAMPERSWERLANRVVALDPETPIHVDLSHFTHYQQGGLIYFTLRALGEGRLTGAAWEIRQAPKREPKLVLSVTTFRREAAVQATVARFESYMRQSPVAGHLHLLVVDNGQSAGLSPTVHVTPITNENLGGSGGFARGLLEAERRGATHCLFMDDDASIHMASLERTWAFLAHATDDRTAVAGGMTMGAHRWALWESGALFDRSCRPLFMGTDLRDFGQVMEMEVASTRPAPDNYYGGWWFFAFPIAHARYRPFPFFVRGDDVSFSIANDFDIVTLPGVLCFQDEDFSDKESLLTLYLDLRSHLAHHLALPVLDIGRNATLRIAARFFLRSLVQCHYESCAALSLALEDTLRGPTFFADNADMAQRRAQIGKMRQNEAWKAVDPPPAARRQLWLPSSRWKLWLMLFSLNGHLLPFFGMFGDRRILRGSERGELHKIWGAREITYTKANGEIFTVRHSKRVALREGFRFARVALRFLREYPQLRQSWREGYGALASNDFWERRLGLALPRAKVDAGAPNLTDSAGAPHAAR